MKFELPTHKTQYFLIFIICLAAAFRFYHIDYQSVWLDEICSITEADPNIAWSDLETKILASDPHPPLYFALLKIMFLLFGYTTFVARIFSAIVGVLGIYAIFLLGKEIKNSKVGLMSAALLAVNYFHIYHSQEVRMYGMLMLFTTLSFYGLLRFLKQVDLRNAILYGVFTGLMLATQFFGLFVLMAQLCILLVYFLQSKKADKKNFVYKALLSGGIMVLLFLPALNIFIETTKKKYAAIKPTTIETIKQIFKDFAQESGYLIILACVAMAICFYVAIRNKIAKKETGPKVLFILLTWISITMIIPIVRSYLVTPMIVSRYFITILPAILLLIALGIDAIKYNLVKYAFLGVFIGLSLHVLVRQNDYYNQINKTQFREITQFILKENKQKDQVVSNLSWYLTYLLNDDSVVQNTLEEYTVKMKDNPLLVRSFWFVAAFGNNFEVSDESAKFLDAHFVVVQDLHLHDAHTKYYKVKEGSSYGSDQLEETPIHLSEISDDNWIGGVGIKYNIFLLPYSAETEQLLNGALGIKFKDGRKEVITGYEKVGQYIHLTIEGSVTDYKDVAAYPNTIVVIRKKK